METLEQLKFELIQKESDLERLQLHIFTLNPEIGELVKEISELREKIAALEEEQNG